MQQMHVNPRYVGLYLYCVIGLIWSGGRAAWLIALGILIAFEIVVSTAFRMESR